MVRLDERLDGVGHMRDDLNRGTQIITATFARQHIGIDPAGGDIVGTARMNAGEPFVMTKIKVGLGPVIGHEHLAMLGWRHCAGIDIQIGIEFTKADLVASRLKQGCKGGGTKALSKGRNHATSDKEISRHGPSYYRNIQRYVSGKITLSGSFIRILSLDKVAFFGRAVPLRKRSPERVYSVVGTTGPLVGAGVSLITSSTMDTESR